MTKVQTKITGESFTHRLLWECCLRQLEAAEVARKNKTGPIYFELCAMLMAYLTYEAYINFLGDRLAPDVWKDERNFFNRPHYKGIEGKLKKITEICKIKDIEKGKPPYQTIRELNKLRNFLSHGKPEKYEKTVEHSKNENPPLFRRKLNELVSPDKAKRAAQDVESFIEFLHGKAREHVRDFWFGDKALEGIHEYSSGDTITIRA